MRNIGRVILRVLNEFEIASGLAISLPKTSFFSGGLSDTEIQEISEATELRHNQLPVRYLGLPLCTKKPTKANCLPLLQAIKGKLSSWTSRSLSFAGRQQLLNSVINGITTFWSASIILPKSIIKKINSLCASFLWKGDIEGHYNARVAWDTVTCHKSEGGLGMRNLQSWNQAAAVRLIFHLFFTPSSVWAKWILKEYLSDKVNLFWTIKEKQKNTWLFNKLIRMRDCIYPWISVKIGNGVTCSLWHDNWSPFGRLTVFLNYPGQPSGIPLSTTIAQLWRRNGWALPLARSETQVQVQAYLSSISLTEDADTFHWKIGDQSQQQPSTSQIYNDIKPHLPLVPWSDAVWIAGGIPKHRFLSWLFVLNRCPTRDRLTEWGLAIDPICLLCNQANESRDHLFFTCPYSWNVWTQAGRRCQIDPPRSWTASLQLVTQPPGSRLQKRLLRLVWQSSIYLLWQERNHRLHRSTFKPPDRIFMQLDTIIRNRATSLRPTRGDSSSPLLQLWLHQPPPAASTSQP